MCMYRAHTELTAVLGFQAAEGLVPEAKSKERGGGGIGHAFVRACVFERPRAELLCSTVRCVSVDAARLSPSYMHPVNLKIERAQECCLPFLL